MFGRKRKEAQNSTSSKRNVEAGSEMTRGSSSKSSSASSKSRNSEKACH